MKTINWTDERYDEYLAKLPGGYYNKGGILYWFDREVVKIKHVFTVLSLNHKPGDTVKTLYLRIQQKYVGIKRKDVVAFIQTTSVSSGPSLSP